MKVRFIYQIAGILLIVSCLGLRHDVPLATFDLTVEDRQIDVAIEFDKTDLESVLSQTLTQEQVKEYVITQSQWHLNEVIAPLELCGFDSDSEHYYLEGELIHHSPIKRINVFITCLVDEIQHHSNIIYVHQKGKEMMGFRLHQQRKKTVIDLALAKN